MAERDRVREEKQRNSKIERIERARCVNVCVSALVCVYVCVCVYVLMAMSMSSHFKGPFSNRL